MLLATVICSCPPPAVASAQNTVFSTKVEAVRVDALVTERENGPAIVGLGPADFEVYDNGVPQQVDLVSFDAGAAERDPRARHERQRGRRAARSPARRRRRAARRVEEEDQAALVTFSHAVALGAGLTNDVARGRRAIDERGRRRATPRWSTGPTPPSRSAESDAGRALVIVFSDGVDTVELAVGRRGPRPPRSDRTPSSTRVSARSRLKPEFLRDLTSLTGGRLFEVEKTATLGAIFVRRSRGVPTPVSGQLHAARRREGRLAPARGAGERAATSVKARPGYLAGSRPLTLTSRR